MAVPSPLPVQVTLPDGASITLRELQPCDEPVLRAWFASLGPAELAWPRRTDDRDHAVVASDGDELLGIARMIELCDDSEVAEVVFHVGDVQQRRRIGSTLRDMVIAIARARGYRTLYAYVVPENVAIRRLLGKQRVVDRGGLLELAL